MAKIYCSRCGFGFEGGCPTHTAKKTEPVVVDKQPKPKRRKFFSRKKKK